MLKTIKDAVEEVTGLKINKNTRQREYVMARCLFYHFARELTGKTICRNRSYYKPRPLYGITLSQKI